MRRNAKGAPAARTDTPAIGKPWVGLQGATAVGTAEKIVPGRFAGDGPRQQRRRHPQLLTAPRTVALAVRVAQRRFQQGPASGAAVQHGVDRRRGFAVGTNNGISAASHRLIDQPGATDHLTPVGRGQQHGGQFRFPGERVGAGVGRRQRSPPGAIDLVEPTATGALDCPPVGFVAEVLDAIAIRTFKAKHGCFPRARRCGSRVRLAAHACRRFAPCQRKPSDPRCCDWKSGGRWTHSDSAWKRPDGEARMLLWDRSPK